MRGAAFSRMRHLAGRSCTAWEPLNYSKLTYAKALFVCVGCDCDRALHNRLPLFSCARSFWLNPLQRFQPGIASYLRHQGVTIPYHSTKHDSDEQYHGGLNIFFHVEDEDSRARYSGKEGLFAEGTDTWVDFKSWDWRLLGQIERHLDWGNRVPPPFSA